MTDAILRERLKEFEDRAKAIDGSNYHLACLHLGPFGWTATLSLKLPAPSASHYFATAVEAMDDLDRRLSATEDRDGNLARTLGIEAA